MENKAEYSELRAELRQWDTTCVTVLGFLGGLWTAVYGFSDLKNDSFVLVVLSILWIIGTFYIVDKRFQIRKISLYIRTVIEAKDTGTYWETWQKENSERTARIYGLRAFDNENIRFLRFSPVEMEILLALFVVISNTIYLYWISYGKWTNPEQTVTIVDYALSVLSTLIALGFIWVSIQILSVYKRAREE